MERQPRAFWGTLGHTSHFYGQMAGYRAAKHAVRRSLGLSGLGLADSGAAVVSDGLSGCRDAFGDPRDAAPDHHVVDVAVVLTGRYLIPSILAEGKR